jgi:hypothetical protein
MHAGGWVIGFRSMSASKAVSMLVFWKDGMINRINWFPGVCFVSFYTKTKKKTELRGF